MGKIKHPLSLSDFEKIMEGKTNDMMGDHIFSKILNLDGTHIHLKKEIRKRIRAEKVKRFNHAGELPKEDFYNIIYHEFYMKIYTKYMLDFIVREVC